MASMLDGCFYGTESKPCLLQQLSNPNVGTAPLVKHLGKPWQKLPLIFWVFCKLFHFFHEVDGLLTFYVFTIVVPQCFIQQIGQEP